MKLLQILKKKPFCNDLHHFLFITVLFLLSYKYLFFIVFLIIYLIYIFKKTKLIIPIIILLSLFCIRIEIFNILKNIEINNEIEVYVIDITDDSFIAYYNGIKIELYEKNHNNIPGDIVLINYQNKDIDDKSYDNDFDYKEYLYSKGIINIGYSKTINKVNTFISLHYLKVKYLAYLKNNLSNDSYKYVSSLVFGDNVLDGDIKDSYNILGLSHILAISGLHIIFMFNIISFILLKVFNIYKKKIPIIILFIYVLFIGFSPSITRAFLFLFLKEINKKGNIKYQKLDILSISELLLLMINPYQIHNTGFILTFLVSFVLIFVSRKENENRLIFGYKSYIIIYFSTLPFVINISNKISLISFLLSPILSVLLTFILLPIAYLLSIFPILDIVFKYIFIFINDYINGISKYSLILNVKSFNIYFMIIYYCLFILLIINILKQKRSIKPFIFLVSYLFIFIELDYINPVYEITFIDCNQGDSCLIEMPFNRGKILIDAYNSYDFLKSKGINHIDYLILSHSDDDHIGDYKEILENIDVSIIYYPIYDLRFNELLKDYSNKKGIKSGYKFNLNSISFHVLGPINKYDEPNLCSIVLKFEIDNYKFLFTGDMELKEEIDLINKYKKELDIDILKVAHHGSNTSSSEEFIKYCSPKYSIISVGKNNKYGLPHKDIVNRLKMKSIIYMTSISGNITMDIINKHLYIKEYK